VLKVIDYADGHADIFPGGRDAGKSANVLADKISFHYGLLIGKTTFLVSAVASKAMR
jgi:hypothetical protein